MTTRPDVTDDVVVEFDHHSDEFNLNELAIKRRPETTLPGGVERQLRRILVP